MAGSATVGVLRVLLTANSAEYEAAMKRAADTAKVWSRDMNQIGTQATRIGTALTAGVTLPLVGLAAASVKAAMSFESSFANVGKTVDGVSNKFGQLTPKGLALANSFRQMAKEIPQTTDELNAIAAMGGQMGVPIDQLAHFTKNVAALGVAVDGISAQEAAASLASIGNATGTGTTKIQEMASALVHLGNNSNATEAEILEFTKRLVGAGNAAGMTVPEVMAIGTAMANVGINAEAGGTAMSTVIGKISKAVSLGSDDVKEFARVAGKSAEEFSAIWKRSSAEGIDLFVKGLSTMKARGVDLNLTMGEIGTEGIRVASTLKLLAGAGDGVSKSIAIANEGWRTGNKHLEEAEKKYATTANQLKILWNQIRDVGITLGNAFLPGIKTMVAVMSGLIPILDKVVGVFAMLPGPVQAMIVGVAALVAAIGPLLVVFGTLMRSAADVASAFGKKGLATRLLAGDLVTLEGASVKTAGALSLLGKAAAVAAAGFIGWQIGRLIADLAGLDQKIADSITHLNELNKARGQTAGGGEAGRAAVVQDLTQKEQALRDAIQDGNKALAARLTSEIEAVKNDQTRLAILDTLNRAIALGADKNITYANAVTFLAQKEQERLAGLKATSDEQQRTGKSTEALAAVTGGLHAKLAEADKQIAQLSASARKELTEALKSGAFEMDALTKASGLSEFAIKRFKDQMQQSAVAVKAKAKEDTAAQKAAEAQAAVLAKQADALERLGVVTENQVLKSLGEFGTLVKLATDAGVPLDNVLIALAPHLDALGAKAKASGIDLKNFGTLATEAAAASQRLTDTLLQGARPAVTALGELPGTLVQIDHAAEIAALGAQNVTDSFHAMGLQTQAELQKTATDAITHFNTIRNSGTATPAQIEEAFKKMEAAIEASLGHVATKFDLFKEQIKRAALGLAQGIIDGLAQGIASGDWSHFGDALTHAAAQFMGAGIAAAVNLVVPGLGTLLQPLFQGISEKFLGLFRDTAHEAANDMRDEFLLTFGPGGTGPTSGFGILAARLAQIEGGSAAFKALMDARTPEAFAKAMEHVNAILANTPEALAAAAGYQTREDLQKTADQARRVYEYMRDSGKYTAEQVADAWQKARDAQIAAMNDVQRAAYNSNQKIVDGLKKQLDSLDTEYNSIFESWAAEDAAPEFDEAGNRIFGVVEAAQRARLDAIAVEREQIQKQLDDANEAMRLSMEDVADSVRDLVKVLRDELGGALDDLGHREVRIKVKYDADAPPSTTPTAPPVSTGGLVTTTGIRYLASGGLSALGAAMSRFWKPRGTDTIPAMLSPGEGVVNTRGMGILGVDGLSALNQGMDALRNGALSGGGRLAASTPLGTGPMTLGPFVMNFPEGELARVLRDGGPVIVEAWTQEVTNGGKARTLIQREVKAMVRA